MAVRQRGDGWQVDVTVNGQRLREQHPTEEAARAAEARLKSGTRPAAVPAALRGRTLAAPVGQRITTLGELERHVARSRWSSQRAGEHAIANARAAVEFFGSDFELADITTALVEEYARWLAEQGDADGTINRKLSALSVMLKAAAVRGDLAALPHIERRPEGKNRERVIDAAEEAAIVSTLRLWGRDEIADLIEVLVDTGLRVRQEGLALRLPDLIPARLDRTGAQIEAGWIIVRDGKGGTKRRVPLTERANDRLAARARAARLRGDDRLWTVGYSQVRHAWDRVKVHLGLDQDDELVIHALRHTCASRLAEAGVPLLTIKEWLGHTQIATTQRYSHLSPNALTQALPALERGRPGLRVVKED
ncbi:MAG: site-specific integrase [Armatimonadetes bacterium]|nr:site-specific integrase [Armatimonadota bacterium]MCA1995695.1 site-specific integrase [Armatimonadota bacterium]